MPLQSVVIKTVGLTLLYQLERLFGGHGRIKKCKVYGGGDALITYHKPNAAAIALSKLNNARLSKGAIIKAS